MNTYKNLLIQTLEEAREYFVQLLVCELFSGLLCMLMILHLGFVALM